MKKTPAKKTPTNTKKSKKISSKKQSPAKTAAKKSAGKKRINPADYILNILDFPQKGVIFKDITPVLANPEVYEYVVSQMAKLVKPYAPTKILAAESRGFFFGPAIAVKLGAGFVPVRKKGKLPRETIDMDYELEYGTSTLCVHKGDINKNDVLVFVDDVLATGGTAEAICKIAKIAGAKIAACEFFYEIGFLGGRKKLNKKRIKIESLVVE